jgi:O-antigen/teichoic acid export membrane protein
MSLIRRNIIANFAGQGWVALMGFVFVPLYLKFIGAEGYGLVGFFVLLSSTMALLDGGLGVTATRQTAAFIEADHEGKAWTVTLLRTIEGLFWVAAVLTGMIVALAAPLLATHWLKVETRRIPEVTAGLRLMAATLVVQFPIAFYSGCLIGLQQQLRLNVINSVSATLRGIGAFIVLWLIAPTIQTFFAWQCVLSFITVLALRLSFWRTIGGEQRGKWFNLRALRGVGRFTAGVGGINVLGFLLTQIDKIVLSKILPLQSFGYYTLAWTLGTFAYRFTGPIFNAYYPRITQLVTQGSQKEFADLQQKQELVDLYMKASRVMAVVIVPFSVWLAFFGHELLALWTRDQAVAHAAAGALTLIALGTMCNGFMHIPYSLQLASGWTGLAFWQNVIAVLLLVPLTYYFATHYGLTGAALPWLILNVGYVLISAPLMYRVMLKGAKWNWYRSAVVYPFLQATCLIGFFYYLSIQFNGSVLVSVLLFSGLFASVAVGTWSSGLIKIHR